MTQLNKPSQHQAALRQALLQAHAQVKPATATMPFTWKYFFSLMNQRFWKVTLPASALTAAAITGILWTQHPSSDQNGNTNGFSFLQSVQAAYAQEVVEPSADSILHQIIKVSFTDHTGELITSIQEDWSTEIQHATVTTDPAGQIIEHSMSATDEAGKQHMYQLYPVGEAIPLLAAPLETVAGDSTAIPSTNITFTSSEAHGPNLTQPGQEQNIGLAFGGMMTEDVVCIFGDDLPIPRAAQARQNLDAAAKLTDPAQRRTAIAELLANDQITDLGEAHGVRGFALKDNFASLSTEYYFDTQSFALTRYIEKNGEEIMMQNEYMVNEYLDPATLSTDPFDTTGLTEIIDEHSELFQKLDGKTSGCYDSEGNQVSELNYTVTHQDENSTEIRVENAATGSVMMIGQGFGPMDPSTLPLPEGGSTSQGDVDSTTTTEAGQTVWGSVNQ